MKCCMDHKLTSLGIRTTTTRHLEQPGQVDRKGKPLHYFVCKLYACEGAMHVTTSTEYEVLISWDEVELIAQRAMIHKNGRAQQGPIAVRVTKKTVHSVRYFAS